MKVLVAGAAIGGLTLAAALRRRELGVRVLERASAPERAGAGAGITIQPNAMLALARLGLADAVAAAGLACILAACTAAPRSMESRAMTPKLDGLIEHRAPHPAPSAAYRWVDVVLEASGREVEVLGVPRPTVLSRQMAIPLTAMYDAWAAYDERAVGTRLGGELRRPSSEHTLANKEAAIAHAVHRALVEIFPADVAWIDEQMRAMGHDPVGATGEGTTPAGVGRAAAEALLAYRRYDGSNQYGDEPGSSGEPYSDTTGYEPVNPIDRVVDLDRWQPIPFEDGRGGTYWPGFLTPHWHLVRPFALESSDQFRPPPYPLVGTAWLAAEVEQCIEYNGSLTLEQKAIVEFMRDGPRSTGQSGHWLQFAQDVSRRDGHGLDEDVKLFFAIANTAFDAFIASWEAKRHYDSVRPWTLIRHLYGQRAIRGWLGECRGTGLIPAAEWIPYSPPTFPTPPFPGYPSGHSTVSGACARMLEHFTGSDRYGAFERHVAGKFTEEGCPPARMQARDGRPDTNAPESAEVILMLPTFSGAAEMAGISRVMGGYHIQADNVEGLALGRKVADHSWPKYQAYFAGTARP